ncbi:cytosine deaminase [Chamaesiphon sp. OTE_20_metabat_361]|uniref:cytosine deaminase n=1 Tax=Chamaesiphon sp. OTE_20_metabat_361 TaxID=2964689 RepID=UPI00286CE49E|nr:cytosine deaminase [Chamaesiphon sp. OTE_20_metabat_361]
MSLTIDPQCAGLCIKIGAAGLPNLCAILGVLAIVLLLGVSSLGFFVVNLHGFLAKNDPVATEVLVVEGWLPDYAIAAAMTEFQTGGYKTLITVGAPVPRGFHLSEYKTFAEVAAATLVAQGFNPHQLQIVSTDYAPECRTQNAATAFKHYWASSDAPPIQSMNVFTLGPHARRTWLVFRKVFPAPIQVGIIGTKVLAYNERSWWRSSEGVRTVVAESIAYLYRRFGG